MRESSEVGSHEILTAFEMGSADIRLTTGSTAGRIIDPSKMGDRPDYLHPAGGFNITHKREILPSSISATSAPVTAIGPSFGPAVQVRRPIP